MATPPPAIAAGLARLWTKFLPDLQARIATLESAAQALAAASLTPSDREAAHAAAHKLAGTLGTFGLPRGTELARHAELAFSGETPAPQAASPAELSAWIEELKTLIAARP